MSPTLILLIASVVLLVVILIILLTKKQSGTDISKQVDELKNALRSESQETIKTVRELNTENRAELSRNFSEFQKTVLDSIERSTSNQKEQFESFSSTLKESLKELSGKQNEFTVKVDERLTQFSENQNKSSKDNRDELAKGLKSFEENFSQSISGFNELLKEKFSELNKAQLEQNKLSVESIKDVKSTVDKQLEKIREDNEKQLNQMRNTVDEKLQTTLEKRLGESFKLVSKQLEDVHKGLGEMQNIATGVGDLKKVLSNVKTRGVLGEYQLGNIIEEILTPDQYGINVATKKGSQANVEYAIKLPGRDDDKEVWMPVDSKFPIESYQLLLDAFELGDSSAIETAQKVLIKSIESFAKDISSKYIDPPHTTDFGIMFLPVESLYAEVLRHPGLFETLQRKYKITVTGPTTLSALLNSLQMGFRTLAVQKRSSEVWDVLGAVKSEFSKFAGQLDKVKKQLDTASGSLDTLRNTRTNQIERKLKNVESLDGIESKKILELPDQAESE